jgi:ATP-binding protein involved in chromosome partitioning
MPRSEPSEDAVLDALRGVRDPLLDLSVVDLGMVRGIDVRRGTVTLDLGAFEGYPEAGALEQEIHRALATVEGVKRVDVRVSPMSEAEQAEVASRLAPPREGGERPNPFTDARTRVVAVSSGKGGVGKSSVTANVAVCLAREGHRVAAVDADVWGFSLPRMLGVHGTPVLLGDLIVPPRAHGVKLISMGFFTEEDQPVIWRGPMLHKALNQFITDVFWGELDFLVIDMPPGTGDVALSVAQFLPRAEVLIVTTPQAAAQSVAQRAAFMAEKVRLPVVGVVENMSWFRGDDGTAYEIFGAGGGAALAERLDVPLLGQVPLVPALREGGDVGLPITVSDPDGEAAKALRTVAERLVGLGPRRIAHPELKIV